MFTRQKVIVLILISAMMTTFAFDYCRDCDRRIADGKEFCNKCAETRQKNSLIAAGLFIKMLDNADKQAKKADRQRYERADRKARAEEARMDRIINSSVNWTANSKTRDRKYYFAFIREDETPLYGYIGDNYTKVDLNKYKFFAEALKDSPTIPKGTRGGKFKIVIMDDLSRWYVLTGVALTYHDARTMTINITELSNGRIRVQVRTGHWHEDINEHFVICDKVLSAHPQKGYYYQVPIIEQINYNITKQDVIDTLQAFWNSSGNVKYIYPAYRNSISFPKGRWVAYPWKTGSEFQKIIKIKFLNNRSATATGEVGGFFDDYEFGLVKMEGKVYIAAIACGKKSFNFSTGKFE